MTGAVAAGAQEAGPLREREPALVALCERGLVPDALVRLGMRRLIAERLRDESRPGADARQRALIEALRASPIAIHTDAANAQHYEVPAEFFRLHLGPRLKYSCGLYDARDTTLAQAENAMLELTARRAQLADGMRILDLGCGWGSLTLWLAQRYPRAQIVALSNSGGQRQFIERRAAAAGHRNVRVLTGNVAEFDFAPGDAGFDRVVSVEMFEHVRNHAALLARIARWLAPDGKLFVHLFAHRHLAYPFEDRDGGDWMSRHFFSGGLMPSADLLREFRQDLAVQSQWWIDGTHYERTANDWLAGMDAQRRAILAVFGDAYGSRGELWFRRWRMFYMAVAEMFGYRDGGEWGVAHYLLGR